MINFIITFLNFIEITCALFLIIVILMQRSKSGGGLGALAGGATEEVFGSNAGNILTKTTVILSIVFLINTLGLAVLQGSALRNKSVSVVESVDDATLKSISATETAQPPSVSAIPDAVAPAEGSATAPAKDGSTAASKTEGSGTTKKPEGSGTTGKKEGSATK